MGQKDYEELVSYILNLFHIEELTEKIKRQIEEYINQYKYTYSGILKTLIWWYELRGNTIEKSAGGIGIVPFIYQDACNYYYQVYLAQKNNSTKSLDDYKTKVKEVEIKVPQPEIKTPKLFNIEVDYGF